MEYMGSREYWDGKFAGRGDQPLGPEKALVENIGCFKSGSVLDLACGDGRNALFLLENGFTVTGVDFSGKALGRLNAFAGRKGYSVDTRQADLSLPGSMNDIGMFDNVLVNHYRLGKEQLEGIENRITPGGIFFVCGFGHRHTPDSKVREEDLIQPDDFNGIKKSFDLVRYIEEEDERGFFVTYIFLKNESS
jgi:tellurite methyltransferase